MPDEEQQEEAKKYIPPFGTLEWIQHLSEEEGLLPTPIDVSITGSTAYCCSELKWYNFDVYPHKVKLTNTGYTTCSCLMADQLYVPVHSFIFRTHMHSPGTLMLAGFDLVCSITYCIKPYTPTAEHWSLPQSTIVLGAKWKTERPYLEGGPFAEKHVLSQVHFHWGANMTEGSEHTVDKRRYPGEMQVTFFRSEYLTQQEAIRHPDGVVMVCYMIKYGVNPDDRLSWVIEGLQRIQESKTKTRIGPYPMSRLLPMFYEDYFLYWGGLKTAKGENHVVRWLVPRATLFASLEQMKEFRKLWDPWDEPNRRNFRPLQSSEGRHVIFINPHWNLYNSLLPIPRIPEPSISVLSSEYQANPWMLPPQNAYMIPSGDDDD